MKSLLKVADLSAILRCSHSNIYSAIAQGELECVKVGAGKSGIRFTEEQVQAFLDRRTKKLKGEDPKPPPPSRPVTLTHLKV